MIKVNDSRIYFYSIAAFAACAIFFGSISAYSKFVVESETLSLLASAENSDKNMKKAFLLLRDPQLFAGYDFFDAEGMAVKNTIQHFDKKIFSGTPLVSDEKRYIELLLDRRKKGSSLGFSTSIFFIILSAASLALYTYEKKSAGSSRDI